MKIMVIYMHTAPGQGQTNPLGQICFINRIVQSIVSFAASFLPLNYVLIVLPMQTYR